MTIWNNDFRTFLGFSAGNYPNVGRSASFTAVLAGASIASITITNAGSGYRGTLPVTISGGTGTNSGFTANVVNGVITSINIGTSIRIFNSTYFYCSCWWQRTTGGTGFAATFTVSANVIIGITSTNCGTG